ncbi:hypothetical protein RvY_14256 [Ramazzottius varieornatus]|uniref:RNA polymerase Rpb4/RPC9 core domain-containing protein n=1 Tax=Ramazzottius varieornatus TaxID=947166 RepID=A0A1D1VQM9_RAMVA|nr:hypothetical protein RvY_14256 [Ramazzottius varieornatus]
MDRLNNEPVEEIEDAKELSFPKEFQAARPLLNSEVFLLLEQRKKQNESSEGEAELPDVFMKIHAYVQRFGHFKNMDTVASVNEMLSTKNLHPYEMAALANLMPETVEEVKSLIPSLETRTDIELQEILDELRLKKSFQV